MLVGMEEEAMAPAASSECSSGCQSGWTTYLDDHSSCSTVHFNKRSFTSGQIQGSGEGWDEDEDDLSMVSDASSGPPQLKGSQQRQLWCGGGAAGANAERRSRRLEPAARRQGKITAAASMLEDTASSPAFECPKAMGSADAAAPSVDSNAVDFSCAFSATTSFKSPLNGTRFGYLQTQHSPPPIKPIPRRPVCREGGDKTRW